MRDDFPSRVVDTLAKRAGMRCSNPGCQQHTSGPQNEPAKIINIGVASHITAASPGGPRYDHTLSSQDRCSISNGIWLCQTCAKLIDNDPIRYSVDKLHEWKQLAEANALKAIESHTAIRQTSYDSDLLPLTHQGVINLNLDDSFAENDIEVVRLSLQLVLALKGGKSIKVSCIYPKLRDLQNIVDNPADVTIDVVELAEYIRQKKLRAQYISSVIETLFSDLVQKWWGTYLFNEENWRAVFIGIIQTFSKNRNLTGLTKIDIWRTTPPLESAPIFVTEEELEEILRARNLNNKSDLAFGPGWVAIDELPLNSILQKALPQILITLKAPWKNITVGELESALIIYSWHVGLETILKLTVAAKSCCYGDMSSARSKRRYQSRAHAN